jgi:hypothetical protein
MSSICARDARKAVAFCLAIAILCIYSSYGSHAVASSNNRLTPAGQVSPAGDVTIDGIQALSGQTFFSGSTLATAANAFSFVTLNNSGRVELSAETRLRLDFSDSEITGALDAGRVRVAVPEGVAGKLMAADVTVLSDSKQSVLFGAHVEHDGVTVTVESGELKVIRGKETRLLTAGETFSTGSKPQSQSGSRQNLSTGKKVGLFLGIGGAVTLLALLIAGQNDDNATEPCNQVTILSGGVDNPCF